MPYLQGEDLHQSRQFFVFKSHLTLQQWMMLIHYWARQNPVCDVAESSGVGKNTAIDVYQWLREVCWTRLINDGPVKLGGPGVIVQTDESPFRHKQKAVVGNRYTITRYSNIAFSIIVEDVPSRRCGCLGWWTPHTTQPELMCKWWTEGMPTPHPRHNNSLWPVGSLCPNSSYNPSHSTVNHTLECVNHTTRTHTACGELWGRVKKRFKSMKGVHTEPAIWTN